MTDKKTETNNVERPLPVVAFSYPKHGTGKLKNRVVRVTEMNETHLKGFEIAGEFDEEPGTFKSFDLEKVGGGGEVRLLHLAPID